MSPAESEARECFKPSEPDLGNTSGGKREDGSQSRRMPTSHPGRTAAVYYPGSPRPL